MGRKIVDRFAIGWMAIFAMAGGLFLLGRALFLLDSAFPEKRVYTLLLGGSIIVFLLCFMYYVITDLSIIELGEGIDLGEGFEMMPDGLEDLEQKVIKDGKKNSG